MRGLFNVGGGARNENVSVVGRDEMLFDMSVEGFVSRSRIKQTPSDLSEGKAVFGFPTLVGNYKGVWWMPWLEKAMKDVL